MTDTQTPISKALRYDTLASAVLPDRLASDRMLTLMTQLFLVLTGSALLAIAQFAALAIIASAGNRSDLVVLMIGMASGPALARRPFWHIWLRVRWACRCLLKANLV